MIQSTSSSFDDDNCKNHQTIRLRKSFFEKIRSQLARFDAYPKTLEDFRIKTFGGATVTIISIVLIFIMFLLELHYYLTPYVQEELMVDLSGGKKLKISFDIVFPHIICSHLSLDATDVSGEQHINIDHNIFKRKLNENGDPIELPQKDNTIITKKSSKKISNKNAFDNSTTVASLSADRCESCYGVEPSIKRCCNTCQDVREAYNAKGWILDPSTVEQCKREGITSNYPKEGCQIFGSLEVNKIAGNFHIALGQSFQKHHAHVHDINLGDLISMNTSHRINHLSFGQKIDKIVNQLDGTWFTSNEGHGLATFQYYVKIIPTIYENLRDEKIETNQFAVTRYKKEFGSTFEAITDSQLPGVFFIYEFGPMLVKYSERWRSTLHFLTSVCAITGGILTGIIDSFIYHSHRVLKAKIQLGKLG
ncbi:Endoplasmic reticulum-Golgi intermediate compartment protein 3 [Sarcoptes scabiei]|nr:Endoplasmic reticulum-Golgi intermediate compartment protein 3 [Sarcoptes scabiei]